MTQSYVPRIAEDDIDADPVRRLSHLRSVLALVERLAGEEGASNAIMDEMALDAHASVATAYADASDVARRRFDALSGEAANYAAVGLQALIAARARHGAVGPAASLLAAEMRRSLAAMARLLPRD